MPGVFGGLYFLGFLVGILLVIFWCKEADLGPPGEEKKGLFAIKETATLKIKKAHKIRATGHRGPLFVKDAE